MSVTTKEALLRAGANQLGVLLMAAGLVALFIQPVEAAAAIMLFFLGLIIFIRSVLQWVHNDNTTTTDGVE